MTVKSLVAGVAALATLGAATAGVAFVVVSASPAAAQVQPLALDVPYPLDQTAALPTADQLTGLLSALADPGVSFTNKGNLVEGGIDPGLASIADRKLQKAAGKGELPLAFSVANIAPAGPGRATADVTVSGPRLAPQTLNLAFVDQGGWVLARDSAMSLIQVAT